MDWGVMKRKSTKKTIIEHKVELPELVEDLVLPAGFGIDVWEKAEKKRLTKKYETIKGGTAVLGPEIQEAFEELRREAAFWDTKRRLLNLMILEKLGYAELAAGETEDDVFAVRRMYDVAEHPVSEFIVNAIWPK
jgi:hypothetical protein